MMMMKMPILTRKNHLSLIFSNLILMFWFILQFGINLLISTKKEPIQGGYSDMDGLSYYYFGAILEFEPELLFFVNRNTFNHRIP